MRRLWDARRGAQNGTQDHHNVGHSPAQHRRGLWSRPTSSRDELENTRVWRWVKRRLGEWMDARGSLNLTLPGGKGPYT